MRLMLAAGVLAFAFLHALPDASAQSSCSAFQAICAQRCKERVPGDTNCVADHCTPKLQECRTNGCWQEGRLYGGKLTCQLKKG